MSKLAEAAATSYLMPKFATLGFVKVGSRAWFSKKPIRRMRVPDVSPLGLVALADLELAAGHEQEARLLVEAAYIAFDYRL